MRVLRSRNPAVGFALAVLVAACSDLPSAPFKPGGPNPSLLAYSGADPTRVENGPLIEAPAVAAAGTTVAIRVTTIGGGCVRLGETQVRRAAGGVEIRPFDLYPPSDAVCPAYLGFLVHETTFPAGTPGVLTVRVYGSVLAGSGENVHREPRMELKTIIVQ
jgi:hypothetical protein